jgi:DNA invertase Pin-like site-specific DNA recombinase
VVSDLRLSPVGRRLRAAQYIRMSTEHQQYSPEHQSDAIERYANLLDIEVVQTYSDLGRSGLTLAGRAGLRALLDDVDKRRNDFSVLLVYDVSRWGRFQDADESAYYEYVLKKAGVHVHYCAEQFANDGSVASVLLKAIKRAMAGEFSRELGVKVFAGQSRIVERGFHQGGYAGFGMRRQLVDMDGHPKTVLGTGEWKSLHSDRVILIPGPEAEVAVVAGIFKSFIELKKGESEIARDLNAQGCKTSSNGPWGREHVHKILVSPKYMGANVFNRHSFRLGKKKVRNPPEMWIRCEGAFQALVSNEDFKKAQAIISGRTQRFTSEAMLEGLRSLLKLSGRLTSGLINKARTTMPSSTTYRTRFGSLSRAYEQIGWMPKRNLIHVESRKKLKPTRNEIRSVILEAIKSCGGQIQPIDNFGLFAINREFTVCIKVVRCVPNQSGNSWKITFDRLRPPDISLIVRLAGGNKSIHDYYVLPSTGIPSKRMYIGEHTTISLNSFRFDNLEFFLSLCRRKPIKGAHESTRDY